MQYLLCSSGVDKCWKGKDPLALPRWVCMFGYALSPQKFISNAKTLFHVPVNTLNHWIETCCGNILFLFLLLVLSKSKISPGQRVQTKTTEVSRGGMGKQGLSITAGKGCKRARCLWVSRRTIGVDTNPAAPTSNVADWLWLLSEHCDPHLLNSKFNLLLLCLCLWASWIPTSLHLLTGTSTAKRNSVFHLNEYWWELEVFTSLWWKPGSCSNTGEK